MHWPLLIPCVAGLVGVARNVYQRLGRTEASRAWARDRSTVNTGGFFVGTGAERVLVILPSFSLAFALTGFFLIPSAGIQTGAGLVLFVSLVTALAYLLLPLPIPRWTMPRWYRDGGYQVLRTHQIRKERRAKARRAKDARDRKEQRHG